jgi:hypothetical protein
MGKAWGMSKKKTVYKVKILIKPATMPITELIIPMRACGFIIFFPIPACKVIPLQL